MEFTEDYYDFHCGNDARFVKVAIKNNSFHTITIHADVAKTIDFSGGTRKIEVIRLNKCFKATRILWPERTGAIRRLFINHADSLTQLDISELTSLEELSIVNCMSLEEIIGLPATLKEINVHNSKIQTLDFQHSHSLHKVNISTTSPTLKLDLQHQPHLQIIYASTKKEKIDGAQGLLLDASNCPILHTVYTDAGELPLNLNLTACATVNELILLCGKDSTVSGLPDCKKLQFFHTSTNLTLDEVSKLFIQKYQADHLKSSATETSDAKINAIKVNKKEFYDLAQKTIPSMYDRETIIQQSGSRKEVDKSRGVKIILLSDLVDQVLDIDENDMMKYKKFIKIDEAFFLTDLQSVYYLPELPFVPDPVSALPNARVLTKENASTLLPIWIKNPEKFIPNYLVVDETLLEIPTIRSVFLKLSRTNNTVISNDEEIKLTPQHKIVFVGKGNGYYVCAALPGIAGIITAIPPAAFATPVLANLNAASSNAERYQERMELVSKSLNMSNQQISNTLAEYVYELSQITQPRNPRASMEEIPRNNPALIRGADLPEQQLIGSKRRYAEPDDQDLIHGKRRYIEPPEQQLVDGARQNKEPPEQYPIDAARRSKEPPEQYPIDGARRNKEPPEQYPIDGARRSKEPPEQQLVDGNHRAKEPDDQQIIDAGADSPPDMNAKPALQVPIDSPPPDMHGKTALQVPIDSPPPDMHGKTALQVPIDSPPPDMNAKPALQTPVNNASGKKEAPKQHRDLPDIDEQFPVDASAKSNPENLNDVPPMNPDERKQFLIDKARKRAEEDFPDQIAIDGFAEVKPLLEAEKLKPEPVNDQTYLAANKKISAVAPLQPEPTHDQFLLKADKKAVDHLNRDKMTIDEPHPQQPLAADDLRSILNVPMMKPPGVNHQSLFGAKKSRKEDMPEQILIEASAERYEASELAPEKLLKACKNLAVALKQMTETAAVRDKKNQSKSLITVRALVNNIESGLSRAATKESVFDAANKLLIAMELLHNACSNELPPEEPAAKKSVKPEPRSAKSMRANLIKILKATLHEYNEEHATQHRSDNIFGTGYTASISNIRARILQRFIDALDSHETLTHKRVEKEIEELLRDDDLRYSLSHLTAPLIDCLTGTKLPSPQPTLKDKK